MKIRTLLFAGVSVLALAAYVHADDQDYNEGLKQELSQDAQQVYPKRPKPGTQTEVETKIQVQTVKTSRVQPAPAQATVPVVPDSQAAAPAQAQVQAQAQAPQQVQLQPVYILQQPQSAPPAQVQPVTNVEDTEVKEPKIESLRKQRENVERQTEDKLMQRLEDDRLESEKGREDRVSNALIPPAGSPAQTAPAAPAAQAAVTSAQPSNPVPVQVPASSVAADPAPAPTNLSAKTLPADPVSQPDVVSATKVDTNLQPPESDNSKFTIGALAGIGSYPTVSNISGSYAAGVALGIELPSRLGLEADGVFSNYSVQNTQPCTWCGPGQSLVENLNQLNITGGLNYFILSGRVTPVVGILAGYTRRSYSNMVTYGFSQNGTSGSNAFDGGLKAGVDVAVSDKLSVDLDFRYIMNISFRTDDALTYFGPMYGSPIEGLNYYFATLGLKLAL